ncbi:MAG: efflux RND transporter periplasmic adaptor subunit [Chloroflexi bacterium]|nr:efflux RND transporter periplasmic adaptor subunit [Chloroflexota bacterium]
MSSPSKHTYSMLVTLLLLTTAFIAACGGTSTPAAPASGATTSAPVASRPEGAPQGTRPAGAPLGAQATATATPRATAKTRFVGNLVSVSQATIGFPVAGRLAEIKAPDGTRVKAGDLIASLDTTTLEIQVAQAQAALDLANANWNRIKNGPNEDDAAIAKANVERTYAALIAAQSAYDRIGGASNPLIATTTQGLNLQQAIASYQGAVAQYNITINRPTSSERDTNLAQIAAAQAALEVSRRNLNNARVYAPFDGMVVSMTLKVGESTGANSAIITIADLTRMQVLVNADETTLTALKVGQAATITLDALGGKTLLGRVKKIGMIASSASGIVSVPVWVEIDPSDAVVYPGLSATVEIVTDS